MEVNLIEHNTLSIEELITILADMYEELEDCSQSEARAGARAVAKRALISEIDWVCDILGK